MTRWGATRQEWLHFDMELGLTADLLPVVSNPNAVISPLSKMKDKGKTPSRYNGNRQVSGFPDWTNKQASDSEVDAWSREPDYGICLQTRTVRALDLDIPDVSKVDEIVNAAGERFPWVHSLPCRMRGNSGKLLLAFTLKGEYAKRIIRTEDGILEFLANGQQFIAAGTHPSGTRYEWRGGLPSEFPEVSAGNFESLWQFWIENFGTSSSVASNALRKNGPDLEIDDPVLPKLDVLGWGKDGAVFITCPFADQHTSDSGIASTVYFPAGTRGYQNGHFHCLHAHCAERTDEDFLDALGLRTDEFEIVVADEADIIDSRELPKFRRNKEGFILPSRDNVTLALERMDVCGMTIRYDAFRDEVMFRTPKVKEWRLWRDTDYYRACLALERGGFLHVPTETMRAAVYTQAEHYEMDSAQEWLRGMRWDGKPRIETFLCDHFGVEDNDYTRAVSRYIWSALAGRVMEPGCKADMVPIFQGEQGVGKSTAVSILAPHKDFFSLVDLGERDDTICRKLRGCLVAEIDELSGLHTKEANTIKSLVSRTHENWVPKFKEKNTKYPRRALLIGTTNDDEILNDPTGSRRWLPVHVNKVDTVAVARDRDQLWAEGALTFELSGIDWSAEKLAGDAHMDFQMQDPWEDSIANWLATPDLDGRAPMENDSLALVEVITGALGIEPARITTRETRRAGAVMRKMGYRLHFCRNGNDSRRRWVRDWSKGLTPS